MKIQVPDPNTEGQTLDVEIDDEQLRAAGFISEQEFTSRFSAELNRRVDAKVDKLTADFSAKFEGLLDDDEFKNKALEAWGIDPKANKAKKTDDDFAQELARKREEWERKELAPVRDQTQALQNENQDLQRRILRGEIVQAAAGVIKPELLKKGTNGIEAPFITMVEGVFGLDPEHKQFFVRKGEDDWEFSAQPQSGAPPYMSVGEFVKRWADEKDNRWAVLDNRQEGPGAGTPGSGGRRGKNVVLTQAQARDHATYLKAQKQAEEQGGSVVVQGVTPMMEEGAV